MALGSDQLIDYHLVGGGATGVELPRYRYTRSGERVDNITDWAVAQFRAHYEQPLPFRGGEERRSRGGVGPVREPDAAVHAEAPHPDPSLEGEGLAITRDAIFAYCYAVLHDPVYRETYALNLKREFPRIPFHPDFARWAAWGEALLALHIGYEAVAPWPLTRSDAPAPGRAAGTHPRPKLKSALAAGAPTGTVIVDDDTQLSGVPAAAWDYRLGNRSAIDWVLDQHKEKTPRDPTIAARFNTYRLADHKEAMIDLLARVVTVSVETVAITQAMKQAERTADRG